MNIIKKFLPDSYKRKIKENLGVPSLHWSLKNLKKLGVNPEFTLDIGAYKGEWTKKFLEVFPGSKILMFEAQTSKENFLKAVCDSNPNVGYHIGLLGSVSGTSQVFLEAETGSHVQRGNVSSDASQTLTTETLDDILEKYKYPMPDFVKLDVQGFELEVLKGGERFLQNCKICLMEVSFLDIIPGAPLINDVLFFMKERDFQPYDITEIMRRPYDDALFQADLIFVKHDSPLLSSKRWQ